MGWWSYGMILNTFAQQYIALAHPKEQKLASGWDLTWSSSWWSRWFWTALKFNHHSRIMNGSTHGTHTSSAGSLIIVKTQKIMAGIQTLRKPLLMALFYYINYSTSQQCGKGTRDDKPLTQKRNSFFYKVSTKISSGYKQKTLLQCMVLFLKSLV